MYSSYGSFKRLGLSTSSHVEPKMSQSEWMSAYATTNNTRQPRHLTRRPPPTPPSRLQRSPSTQAAVASVLRAAQDIRRTATQRGVRDSQSGVERKEVEERKSDEEDEGEFLTDDDVDEDDARPQGGIERQAKAERRLAELRKRHRVEQSRGKREKTKRRRTLKRSTSDVEVPILSSADPPSTPPITAEDVALPTLGGAAVTDIRERTRLLLRDALIKRDPDAIPSIHHSSSSSSRAVSLASKRRRGEEAEVKGDGDEEKDEDDDASADPHALLASDIEQELFELYHSDPSKSYRQHSRDLIFSLVHNPSLTPSLTSLRMSPAELVRLPKEELASHAVATERAKEKEEMSRDLVLGQATGALSDEWTCQGCGGRKTETFVLKEGRDLRKAEVWGGGGDDVQSVILVRCLQCKREWKKEV